MNNKSIADIFTCPNPLYKDSKVKLAYRTCILRQLAVDIYHGIKYPLYEECAACEHGKRIKEHFGEVVTKHKKQNKFTQATSKKSKRWKRRNGGSAYTSHFNSDIARERYE